MLPELWLPLKPRMALVLNTSGWSLKYSRTWSMTSARRASVAPDGSVTLTRTKPWSSLGRKEVGRVRNMKATAASTTPNSTAMRPVRRSSRPTLPW